MHDPVKNFYLGGMTLRRFGLAITSNLFLATSLQIASCIIIIILIEVRCRINERSLMEGL